MHERPCDAAIKLGATDAHLAVGWHLCPTCRKACQCEFGPLAGGEDAAGASFFSCDHQCADMPSVHAPPTGPPVEVEPDRDQHAGRVGTLAEDAEEFILANPAVWRAFIKYGRELLAAGRERFGMQLLVERVRWDAAIHTGGEFKINNNHTAHFARRLAQRVPEFAKVFRFRRTRGAEMNERNADQAERDTRARSRDVLDPEVYATLRAGRTSTTQETRP